MQEIWEKVLEYDELYEISNIGRVKKLGVIVNGGKCNKYIIIRVKGIKKPIYIHRLVAQYFIPNPENKLCVCHIDETLDENGCLYNGADNLFWGTHKENMQDMWKKGRARSQFVTDNPNKGKFGKDHHTSICVCQYSLEGDFIKKWDSLSDVTRELGINRSHIASCCRNRKSFHTAGGFVWRYSK